MIAQKEKRTENINGMVIDILSILPKGLAREISRIGIMRRDFPMGLSEIRVRRNSRSSLVISGENIPLFSKTSGEEICNLYDRVLGGSLYAHIEEVKNGFVSMPSGIRVGISGDLYDKDYLPSNIHTLVFRLPTSVCESTGALLDAWRESGGGGMLIYSLPGVGKTSALRALSGVISREFLKRVAVIDERREFIPSDYYDTTVDILRGYGKAKGIEIAMRTLSPEVIIIDEIGSFDETEALINVGRGGVPIIATTHAGSYEEAAGKKSISVLLAEGYFKVFSRLYMNKNKHFCEIQHIK